MPYKDPEKAKAAKAAWEKEHRTGKRHQVWLAIFYPEDCPGWEQEITEAGIECLVSPLHNRDTWTEHDERKRPGKVKAGQLKKEHRHMVVDYGQGHGVDFETFKTDFAFLGHDESGPARCKFAKSRASSTAYLCHLTEDCRRAGKPVYDESLVLEFCGANYREWISAVEDLHTSLVAMREFIVAHEVTDFWAFAYWCDQNDEKWARVLDQRCYGIKEFVGSVRSWVKAGRPEQAWLAQVQATARADAQPDPGSGE